MNKVIGCRKIIDIYKECGDISFANKIILCDECKVKERISHVEFAKEVADKTKPLSVPEESEECMKEGYEHDKDKRGPRSRPEYERRKKVAVYTEGDKERLDEIRAFIKNARKSGDNNKEIGESLRKLGCSLEELKIVFDELKDVDYTEGEENGTN